MVAESPRLLTPAPDQPAWAAFRDTLRLELEAAEARWLRRLEYAASDRALEHIEQAVADIAQVLGRLETCPTPLTFWSWLAVPARTLPWCACLRARVAAHVRDGDPVQSEVGRG